MNKKKMVKEVKKDIKNITSKGKETINDFKTFTNIEFQKWNFISNTFPSSTSDSPFKEF
jgi:hypothetical protein